MRNQVEIRSLNESDPETISTAFTNIGWGKPVTQFHRYLAEQKAVAASALSPQPMDNLPDM